MRIKPSKNKTSTVYRTLYLTEALSDRVQALAAQYDTSFNNMIVSMLEYCIDGIEAEAGIKELDQ